MNFIDSSRLSCRANNRHHSCHSETVIHYFSCIIAIVFVINDVAVDNVDVDSSFLELEDSRFVVLGDFEGDGSDIEKSLIATSV